MNAVATRIEHDLLGDREIPSAAYYGVHTSAPRRNPQRRASFSGRLAVQVLHQHPCRCSTRRPHWRGDSLFALFPAPHIFA